MFIPDQLCDLLRTGITLRILCLNQILELPVVPIQHLILKQALRKKLVEEVNEYLESGETEELADIAEVIDALAKSAGSSFQTVLSIKEAKAAKNGKFEKRLFLDSVE